MVTYNPYDNVYYFDTTAEIAADTQYVQAKTAKAIAFDALGTIYISNGTAWLPM